MLPTTGFFGGCGIGFSLLLAAIFEVSPALSQFGHYAKRLVRRSSKSEGGSNPSLSGKKEWIASSLRSSQ
jgi:hypothetical protein